jgi:segregation and condensation protein B
LTTKPEHKEYYQRLVEENDSNKLSNAALETLAIIAYNEPITRLDIDELRGVSSSHIIRKLIAKDLIKEVGRADTIGRPILYGITNDFLDYFGLSSKEDLPQIKELNEAIEKEETDLFLSRYQENNE